MKITPPKNLSLKEILPVNTTLLMGAGPVPIPLEVAQANSIVISHLGESMKQIVSRIQIMGQYVFQTESKKILGVAGPSSAAMEMAVTALLWPGRKVLVLNRGTFSGRFSEMARGVGADVTELFAEELCAFRAADVKVVLEKNQYDVLTVVQGETSCGIKNIELEAIVKVAKSFGVKTIVDAVCTLSTMPLPMDEWEIDVVVVGGQKGLSSIPGVSLVAFSEVAFADILKRKDIISHWCLDPRRAWKFWDQGDYHYTAPVSGLLALHEALRLVCAETLEKRFERHQASSEFLQLSLEKMGLELYAPKACRLNSVVAIKNPNRINTKELINHMIKYHEVEIAGAFGIDIIRIGQMGEQCRTENVQKVLVALKASYKHFGLKLSQW